MEDSKWDQPSGEISDRPVSTLFRVCLVWWPAKLPQACLGENRGFWKPSSHHTQPWSKTSAVMPEGRPRHSVWEVCKTIEIQLKGFCYVPPLNNDSLLDDPATMRDFVCQRNWDAYLEHSGTSCSQISKDKTLAEHSASTSLTLLSVRLPSSRGIGSLKVVTEVQQLGCYTLDSALHLLTSTELVDMAITEPTPSFQKLFYQSGCIKEWFDIIWTILIHFLAKSLEDWYFCHMYPLNKTPQPVVSWLSAKCGNSYPGYVQR